MTFISYNKNEKQKISITNTDEIFNIVSSKEFVPKRELLFSFDNIFISPFKSFNLVDLGIPPKCNLDLIRIPPKNGYFNIYYYNFQIILPIYKFFNVFDIKRFFSYKLFTVPQNIIITFSNNKLSDDQLVYDFNNDENNPFVINVNEGYNLFYTFFGCFSIICLPSNSNFDDLKSTISAYSQKEKYTINANYNYGPKILNYCNIPQDKKNSNELLKFQSDIKLFELTKSTNIKIQKYDILIEIVNQSKTIKYSSFYLIDVYFITCLLEKEFHIDRTLFELYDSTGNKLERDSPVGPNKNNKLKADIKSTLHVKINENEKELNYFTKIEDLKKAFNFDSHNFSIIINNQFVKEDKDHYLLIHFLNNSNDSKSQTNIKINHTKSPCHEIILKNQENGKEVKSIIENTWSLEKIFQETLNRNIDSFQILNRTYNSILYKPEDHRNIEIIFIDEDNSINRICVEVIGFEPRIIDLLYSFYKYNSKKLFAKKYENFEPYFGKAKLTFCEKLSNIFYDKDNKIIIRGFNNKKNKSKKIIIDDFHHHKKHVIDYDFINAKEIINLICKKEKYQVENLILFQNYIELLMNDYPTLFNYEGDLNLTLNNVPENKSFWITNCTPLKIQLNLNKIQYSLISEIIKTIFNLDDQQEVRFGYRITNDPTIFKLPKDFNAGSIPENSIIFISYKFNETNQIGFINNSLFNKKRIELSDINLPISSLKREIQSKLNLNEYSLNLIDFSFYQTKLDETKKISDYKINSLISINVDKHILIKIYIPEKTLYKYFSLSETVKDVKNLLKIQFTIEYDFVLCLKNDVILNDNTKLTDNMDIYFSCAKVKIKGNGSLLNQQFELSDILFVSEAIQYIRRITNKRNISIFVYNKADDCYEKVDLKKKLSEFKEQLFVHKIISKINFDSIVITVPIKEQISELNSIKWFKKNFLTKALLIDPKLFLLKRRNLYVYENKKMIDVFNDIKGSLSIEFHLYENTDEVEKKQPNKRKKHSYKPKITYINNQDNQKQNQSQMLNSSVKITIDGKSNIKNEINQDGLETESVKKIVKKKEIGIVDQLKDDKIVKYTIASSTSKIGIFNQSGVSYKIEPKTKDEKDDKVKKDEITKKDEKDDKVKKDEIAKKDEKVEKPKVEVKNRTKKKPRISAYRAKLIPIDQSSESENVYKKANQRKSNIQKNSGKSQSDEINDDEKDKVETIPKSKSKSHEKHSSIDSDDDKQEEAKDKLTSKSKSHEKSEKHSSIDSEEEEDKNDLKESFDFSHIPIIDLNNYKIIKQIGEGGFGVAYLIENNETKELYAAKVSKGEFSTQNEKKQFFMEIDSQMKADNPSVLKLIGINLKNFENENYPTIITEYMPNKSLKANLELEYRGIRPHDLTDTKKYIILLGVALGMKYLYLEGIIHRDLKPDNILLDGNYYPRICDFGLSVISDIQFDMSMVKLDEMCGTILYEAPEIIEGQPYTYKVDVYSFALIAYEILTGSHLFPEINPYRFQFDVVNGKRPDLSLIKDKEICKFLEKCWSANPKVRPTFNEIVEEIMNERYLNYFNADEYEVEDYLDSFDTELKTFSHKSDIASVYKKKADAGDIRAIFNYGALLLSMRENNEDNLTEAVKYIKKAADEGFTEAVARYGAIRFMGYGVPVNKEEACSYIKISADRHNKYSSFMYGLILRDGDGEPVDKVNASKYLKFAADSGIKEACHEYANMHYTGDGIPQNKEEASIYYKKGADMGHLDSMYLYGRMLHLGDGIPKNIDEAKRYYHEAAENGHDKAQYLYGKMCIESGSSTEGNIYLIGAAEKGNVEAMLLLGDSFYKGIGIPVNKQRSLYYYKKAAEHGNEQAIYNVGCILEDGDDGVEANVLEAIQYFKVSASLGNTDAMLKLGLIFLSSGGNPDYLVEASKYFKMGADLGDSECMTLYGKMLFNGKGAPEDKEEGLKYVKMAIDLGNPIAKDIYNEMIYPEMEKSTFKRIKRFADEGDADAIFEYAKILYFGNGTSCNYEESLKYFKMAADRGHVTSTYNYGYMLLKGLGTPSNIPEAAKYLKMAADCNEPKAILTYAGLLMNGIEIPKNLKEAAHYYKKLASLGYPDGIYCYGTMLLFGIGIPENEEEGLFYLQIAAQMGVADAPNKINEYRAQKLKENERIKELIQKANKNDLDSILELVNLLKEGKQIDIDKSELAKILLIAIKNDNSDSMLLYAELLFKGDGIKMNKKEAIKYYKMSADKGNEKAMIFYGKLLFNGIETPENKNKAIEYFKRCIDLNNDEAMFIYASILYHGDGVPVNKKEAAEYFKKSAQNGNTDSMFIYAMMLISCDEIPENKKEAAEYFKICADKAGNQEAAFQYATILVGEDSDKPANRNEALKYFKFSADLGNDKSMLQYANLTNDDTEKEKYYRMSIDNGNENAILKYGDYLAIERGLSKVRAEDIAYLKKAVDLGHPEATLKYGYILLNGILIPANQKEGAKYVKMAVDKDVKNYHEIYALILHKGEGVPRDTKEALKYLELAISKGNESTAAFEYAEILYKGDGVEEDKKLAAEYYKMAGEHGNSEALNKYGEMLKYGDGIEMDREEGEKYIQMAVDNEEQITKNIQFVSNMLELLFPGSKEVMNEKYPCLFE